MTDDSTTGFSKLNDSNYASWAIMMEAELIRKEVLVEAGTKTEEEIKVEVNVQKAKRKAEEMAQACAEMFLRVELGSPGDLGEVAERSPRPRFCYGFGTEAQVPYVEEGSHAEDAGIDW
ncbi:hypothetical protein F5880DRAFT_1511145 [Lentinula raphanica]|nr:hypothetical protein F5880DRAFT_1511145 [Lentinula raphanica]